MRRKPRTEVRAIRADRREFLTASVLTAGGLVLGAALRGAPVLAGADKSRARMRGGSQALNAFVAVAPSGRVTLVMPKAEMGQGTYTSMPMLIAEELEVDLDQIDVVAAPPNPKLYGLDSDGDQSTGGSTSTLDCWVPLRTAGAAARLMLIGAAARRWGVPEGQCRAVHGEVLHEASGRRSGYGALAAAAAKLPVPGKPPLKPAAQFRLIGKSVPRRDCADKVYARAVFGIDIELPGMQVAAIALSPVAGGKVLRPLDVARAMAVRGVSQVVDEGDLVAVVARGTWPAMQGLAALGPRWESGPNGSVQQAQIVSALEAAARRTGAVAAHAGNAQAAMAQAAQRIEARYHQPFLAHATMEPMNCTVHWREDACEFWVGTQAPDRAVAKLAPLGLAPERIIIHNQLIGGGFGRRLSVDGIVLAARVARHVATPVKVIWSREEDIQHDRYRPYYVDRIAAGLDARGRPVAWTHTVAGSAVNVLWYGTPLKNGVDDDAVTVAADPPYTLPNMEVHYVREEPPAVPTWWWRGVGPTRSVFVVESFVDELAAAAKADPVRYRQDLIKLPRLRAVLDTAAERSDWGRPLAAPRGRGVSVQSAFGSFLATVVEVTVRGEQVRVDRVVCAFDCGQMINPDGLRAQLEGGTMFGLSAALMSEITIADGRVEQSNFNDFPTLRMAQAPKVEVHLTPSTESPGGVGEAGTACVMAALCNAIYVATGKRIRTLPVRRALRGTS